MFTVVLLDNNNKITRDSGFVSINDIVLKYQHLPTFNPEIVKVEIRNQKDNVVFKSELIENWQKRCFKEDLYNCLRMFTPTKQRIAAHDYHYSK